jgi:hypothetical protein
MAATIAAGKVDRGLAKVPRDERARRIYRWVVDNVRPGPERSAARVVTSKSGDLTEAFIYLCRLAGVDARLGAVKSRLAPPAQGELSGLSAFGGTAVRVTTELGPRWLVVGSRYAPYGFLPSSLADQPAVVLDRKKLPTSPTREPLEEEQTSTGGARDGVVHRGTVTLSETGAATLKLDQEYHGRYAVAVRSALAEVEAIGSGVDDKRRELVEQRLIGGKLPGAQVHELVLHNLDDLDAPLRMTMSIETQSFARAIEHGIFIDVPFLGAMEAMVSLRSRETPLYLDDSARAQVALKFVLPKGAKLATILEARTIDDPRLTVVVADRLDEGVLHVERQVDLPAGRVPPEEYPAFRELVLTADRALNQPLRIEF